MKKTCIRTGVVTVLLLLLCGAGVSAQVAEQQGELRIYDRATQINTVANREFKDDRGRVVKVIYYTGGGGGFEGPYREELLREQSIHLYTYDDHDCQIKSENYEPGMKLTRTADAQCLPGTSTPKLTITRDARGVKQAEVWHDAKGSTRTTLYFDAEGEKVIAIDGYTPADVDLAHGWGKERGGFACGIAANREKGRQEDLHVWVTIKNISYRTEGVLMVAPVRVELKDSTGRLVEPKAEYEEDGNKIQQGACPTYMSQGAPFIGQSDLLRSYALGERYDRLSPGTYTMTVKHCLSGTRGLLVSNTILLEVEGYNNKQATQQQQPVRY